MEGIITLEACIKNESDPRAGQRLMPHRNIIAHGHDRVTEVFLRVNLFSMEYEVGTWIGETDSTYMASAKIGISDFGKWIHLAGADSFLFIWNGSELFQTNICLPGRDCYKN